jgi:hypothetical protein
MIYYDLSLFYPFLLDVFGSFQGRHSEIASVSPGVAKLLTNL